METNWIWNLWPMMADDGDDVPWLNEIIVTFHLSLSNSIPYNGNKKIRITSDTVQTWKSKKSSPMNRPRNGRGKNSTDKWNKRSTQINERINDKEWAKRSNNDNVHTHCTQISANNIYKMKSEINDTVVSSLKNRSSARSVFSLYSPRFAYWWNSSFRRSVFFLFLSVVFVFCMIFTYHTYVWMPPNNGINRIALRDGNNQMKSLQIKIIRNEN